MAKRRMAIVVFLVFFCISLLPCDVLAASTSDASESINVSKECTLTLCYSCDGTAFEDVSVKLYRVADVSLDFQYTLTEKFAPVVLVLNGIKTNSEWDVIRSTLDARIIADNIQADNIAKTNSEGLACFQALKPGLYLAVVGTVSQDGLMCFFDSALVTLPSLGTDGKWQYQVSAMAKSKMISPSDQEVNLKVVKLWKGDEGKNKRPTSVEVEIFRDGISYKKVALSEENNWSYSWAAKENGADWRVVERSVLDEYTMTVEKRENSFVLVNTFIPPKTDPPAPKPPQTGDTSNIMFYIIVMLVSGSILIILGIIGKRKTHEKSK